MVAFLVDHPRKLCKCWELLSNVSSVFVPDFRVAVVLILFLNVGRKGAPGDVCPPLENQHTIVGRFVLFCRSTVSVTAE